MSCTVYLWIANKSQQQQSECNMTISAVITLSVWHARYQTGTFITHSSDKLPWLPTDFISSQRWVGVDEHIISSTQNLGAPSYKKCIISFCTILVWTLSAVFSGLPSHSGSKPYPLNEGMHSLIFSSLRV
jgi:hypothetical protein